MRKLLILSGLCLAIVACQTPERTNLPTPLPDEVTPRPYNELLNRARSQAMRATEALILDQFTEVEDAARGLEQTAQYLLKATDVPQKNKDPLVTLANDLGKLAKQVREAAAAKKAEQANELLGKINAKVRSLRLSD